VNPISPSIPGFDEIVLAKDQPQYIPLPAVPYADQHEQIRVLTRWRLTDEERAAIANGVDLWLELMTFGEPLQPVRLSVECPIEPKGEPS
jgi:hypothetical protein